MNNIEKHTAHLIEPIPTSFELRPGLESEPQYNLIAGILRRWYIVMIIFIIICGAGLPAIWLVIKPVQSVIGSIEVAPILANILTGEADRGEISNYENFMFTQAEIITGNNLVQRVADNFKNSSLSYFKPDSGSIITKLKYRLTGTKPDTDPASILKSAIYTGTIRVAPDRRTYYIKVTMDTTNPEEAKQIVNAFIKEYMAVQSSGTTQEQENNLRLLETEEKVTAEKLRSRQQEIRQLANEYGTTELASQQEMMLQRVNSLMSELSRQEASRIELETQVKLLQEFEEQAVSPEETIRRRSEYINSDPTVQQLAQRIVQLKQELKELELQFKPDNYKLEQKTRLIESLQSSLNEERDRASKSFDDMIAEETNKAGKEKLQKAQAALNYTTLYVARLQESLAEVETKKKQLGSTNLNIEDLTFTQNMDQQYYDDIRRRIRVIELERKRPARVSVGEYADVKQITDKRVKYSAALVFFAAACGCGLAFLRDKADKMLRTPADVTRHIGIRIIGTTTSSRNIEPSLFAAQIAGDYQTIRTNLALLNTEGMPKKLVVTSPRMREGKTTFAINLATSISKSGKKVLLIDGDLRKPDIAYSLKLPRNGKGLQDVLSGANPDGAICSIASSGLDVLASHSTNSIDVYELIASPQAAQYLNNLIDRYDHVIIDTPPVLEFPDALVWARIAGSAIVTSFAGHTSSPDLIETKERLLRADVKILGSVLGNVPIRHSYYHYGYDYYARSGRARRKSEQSRGKLLMPLQSSKDKNTAG